MAHSSLPENDIRVDDTGTADGGSLQDVFPSGQIPSVIQEARAGRAPAPEVSYKPRRYLVAIPLAIAIIGSIFLHRSLIAHHHLPPMTAVLWFGGLFTITAQIVLAWFQKTYKGDPGPLKVALIIPCFNEGQRYLARVLESVKRQTRQPDHVILIDDGSTESYEGFADAYLGVDWIRQPNQGKKHAHYTGILTDLGADVYGFIDSDSAMADRAMDEILKPFADPRIAGVAGVEWAYNIRRPGRSMREYREWKSSLDKKPWFGRRIRKWFVIAGGVFLAHVLVRTIGARSIAFQLFAMSSQSAARGNVLIAPGAFSAFRGDVIRECKDAYINETFAGTPVKLGDDTLLTLFALMRGRVVQQPTAMCFPAYPEKMSHHLRQWIRWMRASTIRQIWRMRFLPVSSYGWWFSAWQLGAFTAGIAATILLIIAWPASAPLLWGSLIGMFVWPLMLGTRLACIKRSDQGWLSRLIGVLLMPLGAFWYLLVLRWMRFWGIFTLALQGWVTRKNVEVEMYDSSQG